MLDADNALLLVIDVQGRLAEIVSGSGSIRANVVRLVRGADLLGLPIVATEQAPEKLGPTVPEVAEALGARPRMAKVTFSAFADEGIRRAVEATSRRQILVCGIEAHVCVWQTVAGLLADGYHVEVVRDAVSSRAESNRETACARMQAEGARMTSTEMALFEMQRNCTGDRFRAISKLVR
jgi:nicotinamidase-related amidase